MGKLLEDYVKVYRCLNKEFCEQILKELKDANDWRKHTFYNIEAGTYHDRSGDKELDISWSNIPSKERLNDIVWHLIQQYISELENPCFTSWSGFTNIRFNEYNKDTLMAIHCDHIKDIFDGEKKGIPILSVLGMLNEDYEGGKLLMFKEQKEMTLKQGDIMVFPSIFMYPHEVTPVTKGVRNSFVSWVY